ncbi:MAG: hydrogenase expression/formation protein HypE, partial [Dehalococcoidia bacterium]|nr:hydrogenase expression/formation protein HypE [Dehalococcoidia bacterium]
MDKKILLAHGSGGRLSHQLVEGLILPFLGNEILDRMDDSAVFELGGRIAFTTDSYVVNPIFFPGGNIGKLSVCGTVNDLAMSGARPLFLSLAFIIEEGFSLDDLSVITRSIKEVGQEAGVQIVTGDTKIVNRGSADRIFINTAGIGLIERDIDISGSNARVGDSILLSGNLGDHGIAVMSKREGLNFNLPVESDCAPLNSLVDDILSVSTDVHVLRDPTRGGLASSLNEIAQQSNVGIEIYEDKIPVDESVQSACEMLGFDALYVANEGKLTAFTAPHCSQDILDKMRLSEYGRNAQLIGKVTGEHPGRVIMRTRLGTNRIVDM